MRVNEELEIPSPSPGIRSSRNGMRKKLQQTTVSRRPSSVDNGKIRVSNGTRQRGESKSEDEDESAETGDGRRSGSSRSEIILLKPGKHSSPAFRIQVTVHRPLSWQLSSSSNSSNCVPRRRCKYVRRSGSSPGRNFLRESRGGGAGADGGKDENELGGNFADKSASNEAQRISLSASPISVIRRGRRQTYTEFEYNDFDLPQLTIYNHEGERRRRGRRRSQHMKRMQINSDSESSSSGNLAIEEETAQNWNTSSNPTIKTGASKFKRIKKRRSGSSSKELNLKPSRGSIQPLPIEANFPEDNDENENPDQGSPSPWKSAHNSSVFRRQFSLKVRSRAEESNQVPGEALKKKPQDRRPHSLKLHTSDGDHATGTDDPPPVMTCFRQTDPPVHKKSGMGATGSTHGGRLKSRSQSSSALYCIKSNNNGQLVGEGLTRHHRHHHSTAGGGECAYHHHHGGNPLSSSIPADLWDLAPNSKSFSPITRKHSRPRLEHQQSAEYPAEVASKNQKNKHRPFPFVDAFIHRASEKHGKKGKGRAGSDREKFYAVSCPDVAQEANSSFRGSGFSHSHYQQPQQGNVNNPDYGYTSGRSTTYDTEDGVSVANSSKSRSNSVASHIIGQQHNHYHYQQQPQQQPHHYHTHHHHPHHHYQPQYPSVAQYQNIIYGSRGEYYSEDPDRQAPITFPFITEADIFEIRLIRDHRGLGLSVTGGSDSQESYPGLIRIKKVFPMSPAFQSGRLRPYDIILKANGVPLTGLTNHEALEVLRTTPVETILTVCRPPAFIPGFHILEQSSNSQSQPALSQLHSPSFEDPAEEEEHRRQHPQQLQQQSRPQFQQEAATATANSATANSATAFNPSVKSKSLSSLKIPASQQSQTQHNYGEFEVTLEKLNGSLGFTLRQEDTSILGHYVRALVKDPALSDGRIQPGDRILSVNGYDLSGVSHADAIAFLRQCPVQVTLRLYRDVSPTPISPLSPTESHRSKKTKPLRQEAIDMLNDLALRKKMSGSEPKCSLPGSAVGRTGLTSISKVQPKDANGPATLPRRRHGFGGGVTPSPEVLSAALDRFAGRAGTPKSGKSGSPESVKSNLVGVSHNYPVEPRSSGSGESTPAGTITQSRNKTDRRGGNPAREVVDGHPESRQKDSVSSESSLDLGPSSRRKASFRQYTLHLDRISSLEDDSFSSDLNHTDSIVSEPGFGLSPTHSNGSNFRHGQPAYQSAILPSTTKTGKRGKRLNASSKDDGDKSAGRESPSTMSDIDVPSSKPFTSSKSSLLESQQMTSQANQLSGTGGGGGVNSSAVKPSTSKAKSAGGSGGGLLKWKGVVFSQDNDDGEGNITNDDEEPEDLDSSATSTLSLRETPGSSSNFRDQRALWKRSSDDEEEEGEEDYDDDDRTEPLDTTSKSLPQRRSPDGREFRDCDMMEVTSSTTDCNGEQIFTVQLNRRWCSRLGFSLQGCDGHTFISAIYPDSVAAKDGRLRVGDEIIMVNNETIRDVDTADVIDMMRKTRGMINITILRKPQSPNEPD